MQLQLSEDTKRYERKYLAGAVSLRSLERHLTTHPLVFSPIFSPRKVISLYFDTPGLDYFFQNLLGVYARTKVRLRWYSLQGTLTNLRLELKLKRGELVEKYSIPLAGTIRQTSLSEITHLVQTHLGEILQESALLTPRVIVSYQRSYFLARHTPIRATIDTELQFFHTLATPITPVVPAPTILEFKYPPHLDKTFTNSTHALPFAVSKSSKYVMATHHNRGRKQVVQSW